VRGRDVSDLDLLKDCFETTEEGWTKDDLDQLVLSGELDIRLGRLFDSACCDGVSEDLAQ
jgi:hypothetical protein